MLPQIYAQLLELETIVENDSLLAEFETAHKELSCDVAALGLSTHRARLSERLGALRDRQAAYQARQGTPPNARVIPQGFSIS